MERLTNAHWRNDDPWELCGLGSDCNRKCVQDAQACPVALKLRRLAAYEDAEEQGLLVRLPCKVGDTVYEFDYEFYQESPKCETCGHFQECSRNTQDNEFSTRPFPLECRVVVETQATARLILYWTENALFGKTVFLTREEAEAALRKSIGGEIDEVKGYKVVE